MHYYLKALKKYAVFSGRANRAEFWYFVLFSFLTQMVLTFVDFYFGIYDLASGQGLLSSLYSLFVLVPSLSISFRRMHDVGMNGWFSFVPIANIINACLPGEDGENKYGPPPRDERPGLGTETLDEHLTH